MMDCFKVVMSHETALRGCLYEAYNLNPINQRKATNSQKLVADAADVDQAYSSGSHLHGQLHQPAQWGDADGAWSGPAVATSGVNGW